MLQWLFTAFMLITTAHARMPHVSPYVPYGGYYHVSNLGVSGQPYISAYGSSTPFVYGQPDFSATLSGEPYAAPYSSATLFGYGSKR